MNIEDFHIEALSKAQNLMRQRDFQRYLDLKNLLHDNSENGRMRFRNTFCSYYGLNAAGLTNDFKDKYFEILHSGKIFRNGQPRFEAILRVLYQFPTLQGCNSLQLSFVSKLVAIHSESSPLFDRHVKSFFNFMPAGASQKQKIHSFINILNGVAADYQYWSLDERVIPILDKLRARDPGLAGCHVIRLMDFLVWKVGNQKLL